MFGVTLNTHIYNFKDMSTSNRENFNSFFWIIALLLLVLSMTSTSVEAQVDFNTMLNTIKRNAVPIIRFIVATAYVIGLWFVISAIQALRRIGQSQTMMHTQGAMTAPIVKLIVGLLLLYLPTTIDIGIWTLWEHGALGSESESLMKYTSDPSDPFGPVKEGAIAIVRVVGYASFVRGLIILSRSGSQGAQQGTAGKGFLHMIGGILAINIVETIRIVANTLGFTTTI